MKDKKTKTKNKKIVSKQNTQKQTQKQVVNVNVNTEKVSKKKTNSQTKKSPALMRSQEQLMRIQLNSLPLVTQSIPLGTNELLNEIRKIGSNFNQIRNPPIQEDVKQNVINNANNIMNEISSIKRASTTTVTPRADDNGITDFNKTNTTPNVSGMTNQSIKPNTHTNKTNEIQHLTGLTNHYVPDVIDIERAFEEIDKNEKRHQRKFIEAKPNLPKVKKIKKDVDRRNFNTGNKKLNINTSPL